MTDKQIRAKLDRVQQRYARKSQAMRKERDATGRIYGELVAKIQAGCPHRKVTYCSGTPYDAGEYSCDVCGKSGVTPAKGKKGKR